MMKHDTDLPYINQVLAAHRVRNIEYRKGPARKVQIVIPSAPLPSPQCVVIQTLRPMTRRVNASLDLQAVYDRAEGGDTDGNSKAEDAETGPSGQQISSEVEHGEEWCYQSHVPVDRGEDHFGDRGGLGMIDFFDVGKERRYAEEMTTMRTIQPAIAVRKDDVLR